MDSHLLYNTRSQHFVLMGQKSKPFYCLEKYLRHILNGLVFWTVGLKMFVKIDALGGDFRDTKNTIWLTPQDSRSVKTFDNVNATKPVIVNVQQTGFYRLFHLNISKQILWQTSWCMWSFDESPNHLIHSLIWVNDHLSIRGHSNNTWHFLALFDPLLF